MNEDLIPWEESPPATGSEWLTRQFYDWELRGRGWQVWPYPVELEPPFRPFFGHYVPEIPTLDDGRRPTLLSSLADSIRGLVGDKAVEPPGPFGDALPEEEPLPEGFSDEDRLCELRIGLAPEFVSRREAILRFLESLKYCRYPLSFELLGLPALTRVQFVCRKSDLGHVEQQLRAYFPDVALDATENFVGELWNSTESNERVVVEFGLSDEFMLPVRTFQNFEVDPLIAFAGALSDIRDGELGIVQVLFQQAKHPWAESVIRSLTDWQGKPFFSDAPEMLRLAQKKISTPLFATVLRVAAQSPVYGRAREITRGLGSALAQFSEPGSNELIPLDNQSYPDSNHAWDLADRQTRRSGMILNLEELVGLVHLPSPAVRSEKLKREVRRTKAVPSLAMGNAVILGENTHAGKTQIVTLSPDQRVNHTYVVGASGTGKSTLLLNLIVQDIKNGDGVGVLDPHGDLIDQILGYIPEKRSSDVVLMDPSDEGYPVGFNILSAHSELEKNLLSSDLVAVFRRLATSWGDQMTSVLGNAIVAFLESTQGGTLADLRRFLVEADFRREFLGTVRDPEVVYYWQKEFPLLSGKPQAPLLTRLDTFLRPKLIRYMVSQKENRLDFGEILNGRKIFLAKLAQGLIGEENAYLLGTLLVAKIQQLAMSRQEMAHAERRNFYLYIDEFQNFITPSMASILSGARKYRLGLTLAHQELRQLWDRDTAVASAVIANPYTRICFRLGDFDAKKLEEGFSFFTAQDLQNLGRGEAVCRVERAEYDFNLKTYPLPNLDANLAQTRTKEIIERSRQAYGRKREEVEKELAKDQILEASVSVEPEKPAIEQPLRKDSEKIKAPPPVPSGTKSKEEKPAAKNNKPPASETPTMGRGGREHKYLQNLIKRLAESKNWRAVIEKQILGGAGSVDLSLAKDSRMIACEISVASTVELELGNIQKCLAAGYERVIAISPDRKFLGQLRKTAESDLAKDTRDKVLFMDPEEFVAWLEGQEAAAAGKTEMVRGYRVKVKYTPLAEREKETKKQAISEVVLKAMKRLKKD